MSRIARRGLCRWWPASRATSDVGGQVATSSVRIARSSSAPDPRPARAAIRSAIAGRTRYWRDRWRPARVPGFEQLLPATLRVVGEKPFEFWRAAWYGFSCSRLPESPVRTTDPRKEIVPPGFLFEGLGGACGLLTLIGPEGRFLLRPGIEARDRIKRESSGESKRGPLRAYAGKLCERLGRAGNVVCFDNVFSGFVATQLPFGVQFHSVIDRSSSDLAQCESLHRTQPK